MRIEILFPEFANLFGDLWNPKIIAQASGGEIVRTKFKSDPAFINSEVSIVYIGAMTESKQALAIESLRPFTGAISDRIESGGLVFASGNSMEIFGKYIECEDGAVYEGLGLLDIHCKRIRPKRRNSLYVGEYSAGSEDIKIVGYNSRFSDMTTSAETPLFKTIRGIGSGSGEIIEGAPEGILHGGFMGSYILGPLFILNPLFCTEILRKAGGGAEKIDLPHQSAAMDAYNARLREYLDPKTNVIYS